MNYVQVAVNLPVKNIFQLYTYRIPPQLDFLTLGWRVLVPFGRQLLEGFIIEAAEPKEMEEYKDIVEALGTEPWFDEEMLSTAKWLADYYMCSQGEALRLFIPGKKTVATQCRYVALEEVEAVLTDGEEQLHRYLLLKGPLLRKEICALEGGEKALRGLMSKKAVAMDYEVQYKLKIKWERTFTLTDKGKDALKDLTARQAAQRRLLSFLCTDAATSITALKEEGLSMSSLRTALIKGWVLEGRQRVLRDSYARAIAPKEELELTGEQQHAILEVGSSLAKKEAKTYLLQGITGSGKTEVYLRLTALALARQEQVLVLVPEIALTGQIVQRFKSWFKGQVAVAHSKLSSSERGDVWQKMRSGNAKVLIGVRSAVFSPFQNLGLIIIDEEHEYTYKQEERPNYHARKVAQYRATQLHVPVLLGSATPDLNSYYLAHKGDYGYLQLTKRPLSGSVLPQVDIVDMREELKQGHREVLSRKLKSELLKTIARGQKAIILLNRRGYSTFVMCRDCGTTLTCPHCAVSLVYHAKEKVMRCHYCGHTEAIPTVCPTCQSKRIKFFGTGTEKAQVEINSLDPSIKALRMDQDSTRQKFAHEDILQEFAKGDANVLLGTQMVAKGHDIPAVTLVGVLAADSQLNLPDYRSGERTFALLTQAAGRAGRGEASGRVIFQAYEADSKILREAASQNYTAFAADELANRQALGYPPFLDLLKITVQHKEQEIALQIAQKIVNFLEAEIVGKSEGATQVMGPFPAIIAMVNHIYRVNVLVKSTEMDEVKNILRASEFKQLPNVFFDVDPVSVI